MENKDIIAVFIIALIIIGVVIYLAVAKKKGRKCIGCPYAKTCGANKCNCGEKIEDFNRGGNDDEIS